MSELREECRCPHCSMYIVKFRTVLEAVEREREEARAERDRYRWQEAMMADEVRRLQSELGQWREAKLALDTRLEQDDLKVEQFRRELIEAEKHERQLERSVQTFLELHTMASGRTCQCRLCQMFRAALAAEEAPDA